MRCTLAAAVVGRSWHGCESHIIWQHEAAGCNPGRSVGVGGIIVLPFPPRPDSQRCPLPVVTTGNDLVSLVSMQSLYNEAGELRRWAWQGLRPAHGFGKVCDHEDDMNG
jgi:hypothetical protein